MEKITSLEQFQAVKGAGKDFVAITDKNLPKNCVHKTSCFEVKEYHFIQKVLTNGGKNGDYFFTDDYQKAINVFAKMKACQKCLG
ncbi:hypothetical protein [Paenibacillus humicus]|uniref:hypothetical protein n=1 Tax=Paenibacillus humicus TaxID=412861 RepID=UPI000FD9BD40|nr:hypothetical protein [Paenibacillus humicus]